MLAELMRLRYGIAIAGAHGKTTTTSMVALVLERAGLDPTAVIGGRLSAFGSNARLGRGDYMVAEADESDRSFLKLSPVDRAWSRTSTASTWTATAAGTRCSRRSSTSRTRCRSTAPSSRAPTTSRCAALLPRMTRRVITYGLDGRGATGDVAATACALEAFGSRCTRRRARPPGEPTTSSASCGCACPGRHNLLNALARGRGRPRGRACRSTRSPRRSAEFRGAERRFQLRGEASGVMVVDDYGHHPTEIAAVIAAARAGLDRRLVVVFQPHRYTRTRAADARVRRRAGRRPTRSC